MKSAFNILFFYKVFRRIPFYSKVLPFLSCVCDFLLKKRLPNLEDSLFFLNQKSPNPDCSCIISREKKNEKKVDLQIVVPAYNVATYIDRCLNSVLGQDTEYSYQLVVVDDGSTDQTPSIVDQYDKYSNVTIIHQKNKGFSGARNRGLENLIGEYVMFLDSDDALVPGAVDQLMGAAYHDDADIVEGGFDYIIRDSRKKGLYHKCGDKLFPNVLYGYPWGKIYKTNLFNRIQFPEHYWFEDTVGIYILYPLAKKISTIDSVVYEYTINPEGITGKCACSDKTLDSFWITQRLLEDAKALNIWTSETNQYYYDITLMQIKTNFNRVLCRGVQIRHSVFIASVGLINKYFDKCTTNNQKLKHIEFALKNSDYNYFVFSCAEL